MRTRSWRRRSTRLAARKKRRGCAWRTASDASLNLCRHFGTCGGCALQDLSEDAYRKRLRALVVDALAQHGLGDAKVDDIVQVRPGTRRRADFKIARHGDDVLIGFHGAKSHAIADMQECLVLTPGIVALLPRLREGLKPLFRDGDAAQFHVTQAENGFDGALALERRLTPADAAALARLAQKLGFVRLVSGKDLIFSLECPLVHFGRAKVDLPTRAFLQPTREGEIMLQTRVAEIIGNARTVGDLFAGCGTFTLPLAEQTRVYAVEIDRQMTDALSAAADGTSGLKPVAIERRDLFKRPLAESELERFEAVVLDPPRAGALAQARTLASSRVRRIAYVSCEAESFARDAKVLVDGGYALARVTPVDQFLWSGHIELVASFARPKR